MKFLEPKVEWWPQKSLMQHIASTGRICYKSSGRQPSPDMNDEDKEAFIEQRDTERSQEFWKSGHRSMFRHGTLYYYVPDSTVLPLWLYNSVQHNPYVSYVRIKHGGSAWVSTNAQWALEDSNMAKLLEPFAVNEDDFIKSILDCPNKKITIRALMLLRMTIVVTTQISTTRELNRTSPNNIAEQSTRYVNFNKKDGVGIVMPHWWHSGSWRQKILYYCGCKVCEWIYTLLLRLGMKPQDARGALPLDTYTVAAYTYNLFEWRHILDLRYYGKTGAPHPNAKIVGAQIREIINNRMKKIVPPFTL